MRDFLLNRASRILYPALLLLSVIILPWAQLAGWRFYWWAISRFGLFIGGLRFQHGGGATSTVYTSSGIDGLGAGHRRG